MVDHDPRDFKCFSTWIDALIHSEEEELLANQQAVEQARQDLANLKAQIDDNRKQLFTVQKTLLERTRQAQDLHDTTRQEIQNQVAVLTKRVDAFIAAGEEIGISKAVLDHLGRVRTLLLERARAVA